MPRPRSKPRIYHRDGRPSRKRIIEVCWGENADGSWGTCDVTFEEVDKRLVITVWRGDRDRIDLIRELS